MPDQPRSAFWTAVWATLGVLFVLGAIAVAYSVYDGYRVSRQLKAERVKQAEQGARDIAKAVAEYAAHHENPNLAPAESLPASLDNLVRPPFDARGFLKDGDQALSDPWGKPYQYKKSGSKFVVYTNAPDGTPISNSGIGPAAKIEP